MIELTAFVALTSAYLFLNRWEPWEMSVLVAAGVMAVYLVAYLVIPPTLEFTSRHIGAAFGYVPLVSYAAILFPQYNGRLSSQSTRFFGWFGLVFLFLALGVLKLFVW